MTNISGVLRYLGWHFPWLVIAENGQKDDIKPVYESFFRRHLDRRVSMEFSLNSFMVSRDDESAFILNLMTNGFPMIYRREKSESKVLEYKNLGVFLEEALLNINGRRVAVVGTKGAVEISADSEETVFGVYLSLWGATTVPKDNIESVCKKCGLLCVFFNERSGTCEKFNMPFAKTVLEGVALGRVRGRIGDCANLGKKK